MYVVLEVRVQANRSEISYPVAIADKAPDADIKCSNLNQKLKENKEIRDGIYANLQHRLGGNLQMLSEEDRAKYLTLENIHLIKEYRRELVDEKRIDLYNPMDVSTVPLPSFQKKSTKKKKKKTVKAKKGTMKGVPAEGKQMNNDGTPPVATKKSTSGKKPQAGNSNKK